MNFGHISTNMASFWSLFVASSRVDGEATEGIHDIVLLGTMVGSAVVSPVLVDAPTVWHLDMFIFVISSCGFALRHRENIKIYGPLMIPMAALLGLAAYSSAHTPLRDLVPWIPFGLSTLLLLTAYSLPRFWPNFEGYAPIDRQISLEDGLFQPPIGSNEATLDSSQASESPRSDHGPSSRIAFCEQCAREHQVSHMSRSTSPSSRLLSTHDSDIDLDEPTPYPFAQWVSYQTARIPRNLRQPASRSESQFIGVPMVPIRSCRDCRTNGDTSLFGNNQRSSSPGSQAVQCDSMSTGSEMASPEQSVSGGLAPP